MLFRHFTVRGSDDSPYEGGVYHGKLILPPEYPMAPPRIEFLTPNGRFEVNTRICLSMSDFHPESWQPAWGIRTMIEALRSFMPTPADGVASIETPLLIRRNLARESSNWCCSICKKTNSEILPPSAETPFKMATEEIHNVSELPLPFDNNRLRAVMHGNLSYPANEGLDVVTPITVASPSDQLQQHEYSKKEAASKENTHSVETSLAPIPLKPSHNEIFGGASAAETTFQTSCDESNELIGVPVKVDHIYKTGGNSEEIDFESQQIIEKEEKINVEEQRKTLTSSSSTNSGFFLFFISFLSHLLFPVSPSHKHFSKLESATEIALIAFAVVISFAVIYFSITIIVSAVIFSRSDILSGSSNSSATEGQNLTGTSIGILLEILY